MIPFRNLSLINWLSNLLNYIGTLFGFALLILVLGIIFILHNYFEVE